MVGRRDPLERILAVLRMRGLALVELHYRPPSAGASGLLSFVTRADAPIVERGVRFLGRVVGVTGAQAAPLPLETNIASSPTGAVPLSEAGMLTLRS